MNPPDIQEPSDMTALKEQVAGLRRDNLVLLAALILVSFTVTAYLGLQARRAGQELDGIRPMMQAAKNEDAAVQTFIGKLVDYSKSHPEFAARLAKYQIQATNAPAKK